MVIWVFAGGGQTEARGFIPFLRTQFPNCKFERKLPVNLGKKKLKQKPSTMTDTERKQWKENSSGATGQNLRKQIEVRLTNSFKYNETCNLILVIDDSDCKDVKQETDALSKAIQAILKTNNRDLPYVICFAVPEIESWIIADWDNVLSKYQKLKQHRQEIQWCLTQKQVNFSEPELYSRYLEEKGSCEHKLSDTIIDCCLDYEYYSKSTDSSFLIQQINPSIVQKKCPNFRKMYLTLQVHCGRN